MKNIIKILIILIAIIVIFFLIDNYYNYKEKSKNKTISDNWDIFESEKYDFSLKYPSMDWNKNEKPNDELAPKFNFYIKPAGIPIKDGFNHFANITNISVFPKGIPTEGLLAEQREINDGWGNNIDENSKIYILENGEPFAAYIKFKNVPSSWNDSGFVWVRLKLNNMESICYKNNEKVSEKECSPLGDMENYKIVYTGEIVNNDFWEKSKNVVKSISFEF